MENLLPLGAKLGALLKERGENIVVAESSSGGLISVALLSVPGASAYFLGGAVVYSGKSRGALMNLPEAAMAGMRGATEAYALMLARTARERFAASWSIAESGASGPTGSRYGDAAGHTCIAVAGPIERATTLETGSAGRVANMRAFAAAALELLTQVIASTPTRRA